MNSTVSQAGKYYSAVRPFAFPLSLMPVLVAFGVADRPQLWHWDRLAAVLAGVGMLHAAGNLLNDYFDFVHAVDRRIEDDDARPGRMLLHGLITPGQVFGEAMTCLALAGLPLAYLLSQCGPALLVFAAVAAIGLYSYTGPPLKLKYHALGEPLIFLLFGPLLMLAAGFVQTGDLNLKVLVVSVPVGLANTAVLLGNNIRDVEEDSQAGIRTFALLAGRTAEKVELGMLLAAAVLPAVLVSAGGYPPGLLLCPLSLWWARRPIAAVWNRRRLASIDLHIARFSAALSIIIIAAFLIG